MRNVAFNLLGIFLVYQFTLIVDWSLWVSVPVGIVLAGLAVLGLSALLAALRRT